MSTEVKATDLASEREIVQAKLSAYLANPSLAEHNNVVNSMNEYEDMVAKHAAERRRKHAPYLQHIGRAKRPGGIHENSDS